MQGVVLAAGEGTRLRPHTDAQPKALVTVAGQPLLSHGFEALIEAGVEELLVVVGYRGEEILSHYGDSFGDVPITYARQDEQRGTAHALLAAEPHIEDDFALLYGDNVYDADLAGVVEHHRETGADATALLDTVPPERAARGGVFELDENGDVTGLVEKPEEAPSTKVPRGFYVFSPRILHACHLVEPAATGEYELTDAVDLLVYTGAPVSVVDFEGWAVNVNTPADARRVEAYLSG